jgi:hypothetical protein
MGLAGYLLPALIFVCGVLILANPPQRLFYGVVSCLLSLGTWITSNLGGFIVGMLLGIVGACLTFGWLPDQDPRGKLFHRGSEPGGLTPLAAQLAAQQAASQTSPQTQASASSPTEAS